MKKLMTTITIFALENIVIVTSYRAQCSEYRKVIIRASRIDFSNELGLNIFLIRIVTIDSFQDGEAQCVFF